MARSQSERATIAEFEQSYRKATSPVLLSIERSVCGCDYGGTSWTTREEADRIGEALCLSPDKALLDVGAGAGWPALYLAKISGCSAVLVDLPLEGLRAAVKRINADGLSDRCIALLGDGAALPVEDGRFDAISHSDVLCCLPDKAGVLRECRRAIRKDGRMAFTVIYIRQDLLAADHAEAARFGPPFVETQTTYDTMLAATDWRVLSRVDLTPAFARTTRAMIDARLAHADGLTRLVGPAEHEEFLAQMRQKLRLIERRHLERAMFVVGPV